MGQSTRLLRHVQSDMLSGERILEGEKIKSSIHRGEGGDVYTRLRRSNKAKPVSERADTLSLIPSFETKGQAGSLCTNLSWTGRRGYNDTSLTEKIFRSGKGRSAQVKERGYGYFLL